MSLQQQWAVNGKHYSRTLEDWLRRQDRQRAEVLPIMKVMTFFQMLCVSCMLLRHDAALCWQRSNWLCAEAGIKRDHAYLGLQRTYGDGQGLKWMVYWRLFYLACSELFNYNGGDEWFVSHYLFKKK